MEPSAAAVKYVRCDSARQAVTQRPSDNVSYRHAEGSLAWPNVGLAALQAVQQAPPAASLLFVVNSPTAGLLAAEAVYEDAQLAALTSTVQAAMLKV